MGKVMYMRKGETHTAPLTGLKASDIAVGSTVYLMENGTPAEYLVVNQGIPSDSNLYDSSCDGMWLLRKYVYGSVTLSGASSRKYSESEHHTYLNGTFFNLFDSKTQSAIKQVKIPYWSGSGGSSSVYSGSSGLSTKVFSLGGYEVGWTTSTSSAFPIDGACLSYFKGANNSTRVAYYGGYATGWWTRSPYAAGSYNYYWCVEYTGASNYTTNSYSIRPALILPSTALFDEATLVFKGVK